MQDPDPTKKGLAAARPYVSYPACFLPRKHTHHMVRVFLRYVAAFALCILHWVQYIGCTHKIWQKDEPDAASIKTDI